MITHTTIAACRSCSSADLEAVLDLGSTPLANSLVAPGQDTSAEPRFPLTLLRCRDCSLVQIAETVPPEVLFSHYVYFSSFSDAFIAHAKVIAGRMIAAKRLGPGSLAAEVASNDGYLLQHYRDAGIPVLGIEPAANIAKVARERGIDTINDFFGRDLGERLRCEGRRADVIHANNVLAHVSDINGFVSGFARFLAEDGLAIIETPYIKPFLDHVEFDTIYHEHLFYYSLTALVRLFSANGLTIVDVERLPVHGGSLRIFATPSRADAVAGPAVAALLAEERAWGVDRPEPHRAFAERVGRLRSALRQCLGELKQAGKRIAAYGAAAKGSTLLNCFGIGTETLDFVVDRSTYKQGLLMPGVHIPISPPERLLADRPNYVVILAWNFAEEIIRQQQAYRDLGGRFIIPLPEVKVV